MPVTRSWRKGARELWTRTAKKKQVAVRKGGLMRKRKLVVRKGVRESRKGLKAARKMEREARRLKLLTRRVTTTPFHGLLVEGACIGASGGM